MSTLLTLALVVLGLALFALRAPTSDARTPAELRAAVQRAGWPRVTLATGRVVLVLTLLLLVEACRLGWHICAAAAVLFAVLADGIDALGRHQLSAGGVA